REAAQATRALPRRARAAAAAAVACRDPASACAAAVSAARVSAAYLAAITGLSWSIGHTARQTASRRPGRPRREMCAWPEKTPEAFSDGASPARLSREEELSCRPRSPV